MPSVTYNAAVDTSAKTAWQILRQFGAIARWHPAIAHSALEGGLPEPAVGVLRRLQLTDGALLRERLLVLDESEMSLSYCMEESPLPVDNYHATVQVIATSGEPECRVYWQAHFDVRDPAMSATLEAAIRELIVTGHASLVSYLRG